MATYAENAADRERARNKALTDARDDARHRLWDLQAQDRRHKYERFHFAVVGEGSRTAGENYRMNYDRIFRSCAAAPADSSRPRPDFRPGIGAAAQEPTP